MPPLKGLRLPQRDLGRAAGVGPPATEDFSGAIRFISTECGEQEREAPSHFFCSLRMDASKLLSVVGKMAASASLHF